MHLSFRHTALLIVLPIYCNLTSCTTAPSFPFNDKRREEIFGKAYFETLASRYYLNDTQAHVEAARNRQLIVSDRKEARNAIIRGMMLLTDEYFSRYCNALYSGRAAADTAAEALNSGITATATLLTPGHATRTLTAIASGLSGLKLSVDKDLFIQQTAPALVAKMQAQRTIVDAHMQQMMRKDVADYPLEEGMRDFVKYYQAGTLLSAAASLSSDANLQSEDATEHLQSIKLRPSAVNEISIPSRGFFMKKVVPPGLDSRQPSPSPRVPAVEPPLPADSGSGGADASLLIEPALPEPLQARNDALKAAFTGMTEARAKTLLPQGVFAPANGATELLAKHVLASANLDILPATRLHSPTPALDSLTYYRKRAVSEPALNQLEVVYRQFKLIP